MNITVGSEIVRWTVIGETRKNGKKYYTCRCECGTVKDVYYRSLEMGVSRSCGCLRTELSHDKAEDLTGRRIGKLKVIGKDESRPRYWICECECGNRKSIVAHSLQCEATLSCGCIQRGIASKTGTRTVAKNAEKQITMNKSYHTNFQVIESNKLPKNNSSGHKGISWDKSRSLWSAYIQVHGKKIHLGRFADLEEAVKARIRAEETYFEPLINLKKENNSR